MPWPVTEGHFAQLPNGIRLHYASCGEAGRPLLLFLHGFPEFWWAWSQTLAHFGATHYAVAPDLRGFHRSSMPEAVEDYRPQRIAQDIHELVAHLGYDRVTLVAHDWGGAIAWNLAIAGAPWLERLIILNSPHPYCFARALAEDPAQQAASAYMNWLRAPGAEQALARDDFALLDRLLVGMNPTQSDWYDPPTRARYHACWAMGLTGGVNYYRATPLHPPLEAEPGPRALQLDPQAFRAQVPVRVIWGERDQALLPVLLDDLERFVPDLRVERMAEASHWLVHEQPEAVHALITRFLTE